MYFVNKLWCGKTTKQRFWEKVIKTKECWYWTGAKVRHGYGYFGTNGRSKTAHRISFYLHTGIDPTGFEVCHKCDTTSCVNPDHLFIGTHKDNMSDMKKKNRSTQGIKHPKAKLNELQIRIIRKLTSVLPQKDIANIFSVSRSLVSLIHTGKLWRHI